MQERATRARAAPPVPPPPQHLCRTYAISAQHTLPRRVSSSLVAKTVRELVLPVTDAVRSLVHGALATALDDAVKKERGLEPLVLVLKPFPLAWLMSLERFETMARSADGASLLKIFSDDAEVR